MLPHNSLPRTIICLGLSCSSNTGKRALAESHISRVGRNPRPGPYCFIHVIREGDAISDIAKPFLARRFLCSECSRQFGHKANGSDAISKMRDRPFDHIGRVLGRWMTKDAVFFPRVSAFPEKQESCLVVMVTSPRIRHPPFRFRAMRLGYGNEMKLATASRAVTFKLLRDRLSEWGCAQAVPAVSQLRFGKIFTASVPQGDEGDGLLLPSAK